MARNKVTILPVEFCNIAKVGFEHDPWCIQHAAYALDCLVCGTVFHTARPHTRYCSDACSQKAYRSRLNAEVTR